MLTRAVLAPPLAPQALHIPDGFLSPSVAIIGWILLILAVTYALYQTRAQLGERQVPLMGMLAAFIFAAQMINFPVAGGTSGHLLGATLAALLMGPWAAVLIMTAVVGVQGLLFQDGGLLAMGFNVVNMGVIGALLSYAICRLGKRLLGEGRTQTFIAAGVGAWLSVMAAAAAASLELAASGTSPLNLALPAMAGVHALIGIGEALITVGALAFIAASRPDLLAAQESAPGARSARWVAAGLGIALMAALFSPLASPSPDGLERVAQDYGFLGKALTAPLSLLPNYSVPFIRNPTAGTILAGLLGTLIVFGVVYWIGRSRARSA